LRSTIWDAVYAQAKLTPNTIAIRDQTTLSYQEITELARTIAAQINRLAPPGSIVAAEPLTSTLSAITVLATAKAGCTLLPLSGDSPPAYRSAIFADARPAVTVRMDNNRDLAVSPVLLDIPDNPDIGPAVMDDAAYVMYTSGSTGSPKGVVVSHDALLLRLASLAVIPGMTAGESMMAMTALSFDIAMAEVMLPLTVGGTVIAAPSEARSDPALFAQTVAALGPDIIQATPTFWRLALAWGWPGARGSRLWCGGEALTTPLARELIPRCAELWNLYGPTEATIWATAARIESPDKISLGSPLADTGICLAELEDPWRAGDGAAIRLITAPGQHGEIVLHGPTLATGYLNREHLTQRSFLTGNTPDGPVRYYRTGDRAQYRPDGTLEFLGRADSQIKLRGHRIELAEVEEVLERFPCVTQAVAVLRDKDNPQRAHIAAAVAAVTPVSPAELRRWAAEYLPAPMRPVRISVMRELPRTIGGKVDRTRIAHIFDRPNRQGT